MEGLSGEAVIVTGGGGVIGRAICRRFAREGAAIGVFDIDGAAAAETVAAVREVGAKAWAEVVDITDYDAVSAAVAAFEAEAGATEVLVNNAGWDRFANFVDTDPELWDRILGINLRGPINMTHVVVRGMAERGRGRVVTIASDAGRVGSSGEAVYSAAKGGMIALSKTVARELATTGVTLNVVCPGPTDTPILRAFTGEGEQGQKVYDALRRAIPMKRLGEPEDVAGMTVFLASDEAGFITGQVISVSGGLTMHG